MRLCAQRRHQHPSDSESGTGPVTCNAQLTVIESGGGQGSVVSNPAGINCPGTCTASFPEGTQLTLTATAANGSVFGGYTGACTTQGAKAKDTKKAREWLSIADMYI